MAKMLTTKEVQNLLQVDRSTVYRMAEAGRLPAMKVGKQWRFPAQQIEDWLQGQRGTATTVTATATATEATLPTDLATILPLACVQLIQDTFAEVLGAMIAVTDMQGQPVTKVSNPCGLFKAISPTPQALQYCIAGWGELAQNISLKPELTPGHFGLLGTRAFIRCGTSLQGMVFIGGIAPSVWPPDASAVEKLATQLGLSVAELTPVLAEVFYLDEAQETLVLATVQRIADILSHIVAERTVLTGKLESIARLINIEETLS